MLKPVIYLSCFIWASTSLAQGWYFQPKDVTALHHDSPTVKLAYGKNPAAFGLLRVPKIAGSHPVIMIIHGGCWLSNIATVNNTEPLANALTAAGYATWNIEYRQTDNPGGGYPGTFADVAAAADYLLEIAPTYHLDLNHSVVIGHSAGGQLALWVAGRRSLPKSSPLFKAQPMGFTGVISLGGVTDLKVAKALAVKVCGSDVIGHLLGNPTAAQWGPRLAETSPVNMLPMHVKQMLIYGKDDEVVPAAIGEIYLLAAKAKGEPVGFEIVPYAAHQEYIVPNSVVWPVLLRAIEEMIEGDAIGIA